jgi:hypothetical protein
MPGEALRSAGNLSPELSSPDTLLAIDFDPPASFVANRSCREYFLHWRPIGLDPTTVMAAVAAGGMPICVNLSFEPPRTLVMSKIAME